MDQGTHDYCIQLVKELIDGVDTGDFSKDIIPDKYRWEHLLGLFLIKDELDGGDDLFRELHELAIKSGTLYLRKKVERGEPIQIAFQSYSAAQWPAEQVYRKLEAIPNVNVRVIVAPLADRDTSSILSGYVPTLKWFKDNGYNVVEGLDVEKMECGGWEYLGGCPDVLYQMSSWYTCLARPQWFTRLPLRVLMAYIPYGIHIADSADGKYSIDSVYNKDFMNLMWRVYCDSRAILRDYQKYQLLKGSNIRYCGYAKMDYFYGNPTFDDAALRRLWSVPKECDASNMKKIIIAPHYTVFPNSEICYSTFHRNVWFWLYLVKKYEDKVCFVFKPHPNLRRAAVGTGLFKSYEDYDKYIQTWDESPNACAVPEGDYLEYFASSDAMIMDSGSFIGEYLYTGKPLLYLTRPEQTFMEIGWKVLDSYYKAPGEDYAAIEQFIQDVVLDGKDTMAEDRKRVFEEEYDYYKINGQLASDFIVNEVKELIS